MAAPATQVRGFVAEPRSSAGTPSILHVHLLTLRYLLRRSSNAAWLGYSRCPSFVDPPIPSLI